MRILVAVPSISIDSIGKSKAIKDASLVEYGPFEPTYRSLDCFHKEIGHVRPPSKAWGINVPHWPLEDVGASGVYGPSSGDKVFDDRNAEMFLSICGKYDKWRPYPSESLSNYSLQTALRFSRKRCRMFKKVCDERPWELVFYAEHSPASVAHLDESKSIPVVDCVISNALEVSKAWPNASLLIFSPYGTGNSKGFVVSNMMEPQGIGNWDFIRKYMSGERLRRFLS